MPKTFNILSIDFDFFQDVEKDTLSTCYPDGVDLPTSVSKIIWSSYYAAPATASKIKAVKIDQKSLDMMESIIAKCRKNIPVMVTNSHVQIYDFIHKIMEDNDTNKLNIAHVDMHHDMMNDNYEIDCGNWIKFISDDYNTSVTWIAKPVSFDMYGLDPVAFNMVKLGFESIDPEKIDAVFLCRSDAWLPPHLDEYFDKFKTALAAHFDDIFVNSDVAAPRDISALIEQQKPIYDAARM